MRDVYLLRPTLFARLYSAPHNHAGNTSTGFGHFVRDLV